LKIDFFLKNSLYLIVHMKMIASSMLQIQTMKELVFNYHVNTYFL